MKPEQNRTLIAIPCFYLFVAIISFGHSAANSTPCRSAEVYCDPTERAAVGASLAAMFWPLYLSWVYFDTDGQN